MISLIGTGCPGCSVITKRHCSDRSGCFRGGIFPFLSSLLLPHFESSQSCSLFCSLRPRAGLVPSPSSFALPPPARVFSRLSGASVSSLASFLMLFLPFSWFPCPVVLLASSPHRSSKTCFLRPLRMLLPAWLPGGRARVGAELLCEHRRGVQHTNTRPHLNRSPMLGCLQRLFSDYFS